jgi:ankyrin repeat protein
LSTVPLPGDPSLEKLRNLARRLQRSVRAGDPKALASVAEHHPGGGPAAPERFPLSAAQLVTARQYGFPSWPALKHHLDIVERYSWNPNQGDGDTHEDPADLLCRLACLRYQDDNPDRRTQAQALLGQRPQLSGAHIWAAATAGDLDAVRRLIAADPALATRRGGPFSWCPMFYLAYSRLDPDIPAEPVLRIARLLLDAGADPNEGYLWRGLPTPFTLLTGTFGHGELGSRNQPAHPHSVALARILLDAGADPNDGQALYNRMFEPDNDHLELLLEYGLGTGSGGPWKARLGRELASPREMLRGQLDWALAHDQLARVQLLVGHGIDTASPDGDGHTPIEVAALCGNTAIVDYLLTRGTAAPNLEGVDGLLGAVMAGDRARALAFPAAAVTELRARPWLVVWAAARGRAAAVQLLLDLGFDVNAFGRGDMPGEQEWQTALHTAAGEGHPDIVRLLLAAGADPDLRDSRFHATPLEWATYGRHEAVAEILAPITQDINDSETPALD